MSAALGELPFPLLGGAGPVDVCAPSQGFKSDLPLLWGDLSQEHP